MPPPIPSRARSQASSISSVTASTDFSPIPRENTIHLTPQAISNHPYSNYSSLDDPRTSSTQSLRPDEAPGPFRRTLLMVYIHGFMGNETSFRSFPAHVHSLLSLTLAESHVVYTKIYPRYQSRKNISFARDAFSNWLAPHESDTTDVILIGHSLGGILGAEVALIPSHNPGSPDAFQHRILGLIAYDTPFLGMHPGVVSTGIASLFRGAPEQSDTSSSPQSSSWTPADYTAADPNFNPAYNNDVNLPVRTNKWEKAWYFWNKHYGELRKATQSYVKSHLEFGGCLADIPGLKRRYDAIRSLEDVDGLEKQRNQAGKLLHRVRFVNYYTASTGRIKEQKPAADDMTLTTVTELQSVGPKSTNTLSPSASGHGTPRLSLEEHRDGGIVDKTKDLELGDGDNLQASLNMLEPVPHEELDAEVSSAVVVTHDDLPPIPPEPIPPSTFDPTQYTDPDILHLAQKEYNRQLKAYESATTDRQEAIEDRERVIAKREQHKRVEDEALNVDNEEDQAQEDPKRQSTLNPEDENRQLREDSQTQSSASQKKAKKKKDRKFCTLPSKNQFGQRDSTWVRVYMEGVDEVVAHTSLFFIGDTYARLVSDTADRVEQWVAEDATMRMLLHESDSR